MVLLLAGALLAWQALPAGFKTRALLLTAAGCLLDLTAVSLGLYRFAGVGALPLWTATLWLSFSVWWLALLKDWRPSPRLLAVIGAIAGPLAYCWWHTLARADAGRVVVADADGLGAAVGDIAGPDAAAAAGGAARGCG